MDQKLVEEFKKNNEHLSTEEILKIWMSGDRSEYREAAYEAFAEILKERLGYVPNPSGPMPVLEENINTQQSSNKNSGFNSLKKLFITILILFIAYKFLSILTINATIEPDFTATKSEETQQNNSSIDNPINKPINKIFKVSGLEIIINEVNLYENKVLIKTTIKNNSKNRLSLYPDSGNVVIGSVQLDANAFSTTGAVSGDIESGVVKTGEITFFVPEGKTIAPEKVKSIALHWGPILNQKSYTSITFDKRLDL